MKWADAIISRIPSTKLEKRHSRERRNEMDFISYITENALILIPVLVIIGQIVKGIEKLDNKWIPLILLPLGIVGAMALGGWTVEGAIQGVLVAGAAVYSNQIVKQLKVEKN